MSDVQSDEEEAGLSWEVPAALDGERVDRTVSLLTGLPRAAAAQIVSEGRVRVGRGAPVGSGSRRVHKGERLRIDGELVVDRQVPGEDLADRSVQVNVVDADSDVIVVDKPAGLVVHPGAGNPRGTLIQGLVAIYPDLMALAGPPGGANSLRPGVVHRLDRGSSGLLVVARNENARASLVAQLARRSVERRYRALAVGTVIADEGLIDAPLGRSTSDPTRRAVRADGREARTTYEVETRYRSPIAATLLRCRLETGRTHQIRVHLSAIGHPLVGDGRYGGASVVDNSLDGGPRQSRYPGGDRPWLHAETLGFDHPASGSRCRYHSVLPDDLLEVLGRLDEKGD